MPVYLGPRWQSSGATTTITWSFAETNIASLGSNFSGYKAFDGFINPTYRDTIRAAFAAWEAIANIDFVEVSDSSLVNIRVGNENIDGRTTYRDGSVLASTLSWALAGVFGASQIYFDIDAYEGNLYQTAVHEIGHALGLDHSAIEAAVMYYELDDANLTGALTADDLEGVRTIYGSRVPEAVVDDYLDGRATEGVVAVGGSVVGVIGVADDVDWFKVELVAGRTYRFDLLGSASGRGSLYDTYLQLRDSAGTLLKTYDEGGAGHDARGEFTATMSGVFYLAASAYDDATGFYRLNVSDITAQIQPDDYAFGPTTTGRLAVGASVTGVIETARDGDSFAMTLTPGHTYRFELEGEATGRGTLSDPVLDFRNSNGALIAVFDEEGVGHNAMGYSTALAGGTYYASAWSYDDNTGSYHLSVTDITATLAGYDRVIASANNILRTYYSFNASGVSTVAERAEAGTLSATAALAETVKLADATTSVATLSYQFFTGKIPSLGGIDYLVSTTGGNANNLNSAYYQSFSMENRYINFAVNLGVAGDGKASFLASYGGLSLFDATKKAYQTIFGSTPTDAKAHALIDTRVDYFAYYGGDGAAGIGTKAAMVGWLLAEAAKADLGTYSKANDAFLTDLADGATFAVDLIAVYGRPDFAYLG